MFSPRFRSADVFSGCSSLKSSSSKKSPNSCTRVKFSLTPSLETLPSLLSFSNRISFINSLSVSCRSFSLFSTVNSLIVEASRISSFSQVFSKSGVSPSNKSARVFNSAIPTSGHGGPELSSSSSSSS